MRYRFFALSLLAAALFLCPATVHAAETETASTYYTLSNQERYTLIHEVKLNNYGLDASHDVVLKLPLMDKDSPVYSRKVREQIVPWPDEIETDARGRRTAYYYLDELASGAELVFTQRYVIDVANIRYANSIARSSGSYEDQLESRYLLPSLGIESDHEEIIAFAKQISKGKSNPYDVAKDAFSAVNLYMTYESDNLIYGGALRALHRAKGVCEDYSSLYVAVLRALGIAARQQGGYLYLPNEQEGPTVAKDDNQRIKMNQMRHTWVEFYIPGEGWIVADPTFTYSFNVDGVPTKFPNWNYFASITSERRYLFFCEGFVKEEKGNLWVGEPGNSFHVEYSFDTYLMQGSQAAFYNDLPGHWAESAIMRLSEREEPLLQGLGNGMFGVNESMTRAQLVTFFQRLLKSPPAGPKFTDLPISHWAYRDIGAAQQAGWINGYPDGSFRPDTAVTRAELAQLLVDIFELQLPEELPQTEPAFADLGQPGYAWADNAISVLAALGLTQGNGDGYYQPQRPVTRAEFATFLDRIMTEWEK